MVDTKRFEEKTLTRTSIFEGQVIQVVKDEVSLPDGSRSYRELVLHRGAVAVAPVIDDKILLVGQYRKAFEQFIYEIPAGKLELGEDQAPEVAALRELEEETGYTTKSLTEIACFYSAPGFSNERIYLYFTSQLIPVEHPRPRDADEFLEVCWVTLEEAKSLVANGDIADAKTLIALQYWELHHA